MDDYLAKRKEIVAAREVFFLVLRNFLSQQQANAVCQIPARNIADNDWVTDSHYGYLTIKENKDSGRDFRVSILQMGNILRIGTRLSMDALTRNTGALERISNVYPNKPPVQKRLTSGEIMFDWSFDVPDLYTSTLSMETSVFMASSLFENALYATVKELINQHQTKKIF